MAAPQHHDATADVYDTSVQHHEALNDDAHAEQGRDDELAYFKGTAAGKSTKPRQDSQHNDLHRRHHPQDYPKSAGSADAEKGAISSIPLEEDEPQSHEGVGFYTKYRIFSHIFIWLFFTG